MTVEYLEKVVQTWPVVPDSDEIQVMNTSVFLDLIAYLLLSDDEGEEGLVEMSGEQVL